MRPRDYFKLGIEELALALKRNIVFWKLNIKFKVGRIWERLPNFICENRTITWFLRDLCGLFGGHVWNGSRHCRNSMFFCRCIICGAEKGIVVIRGRRLRLIHAEALEPSKN